MLTMAEERDVTQSVKALRELWFTQIAGSGIVGGAVFYAYSGNPAKLSEDTVLLVRMIFAGLSVLVFLAGRVIVTVRQKCKVCTMLPQWNRVFREPRIYHDFLIPKKS